jgi:hypothetical protein
MNLEKVDLIMNITMYIFIFLCATHPVFWWPTKFTHFLPFHITSYESDNGIISFV